MESLISSIWNFDGLINSALIFVTFGLLGVFIWKRAGSAYSLLNRLWEFCTGGKTFHDGKIMHISMREMMLNVLMFYLMSAQEIKKRSSH